MNKINEFTHVEKQQALAEAHKIMNMKVYRMNDYDWVAAESDESAKKFYEQFIEREELEEDFQGEVPLEDTMFFWEEDVPVDERHKFSRDEIGGKGIYHVPFSWVIVHQNITEPCIIASTEY